MGNRMMKQLCCACTAREALRCEKYHFAFSARQPFYVVQVTVMFHQIY